MTRIENEWAYFDDKLQMRYPWYTSPCLKVIEQWDLKGKHIFEYGVGYSTLWYRIKGAKVSGVDNNIEWVNKTNTHHAINKNEYVESMPYGKMYDIICIDGIFRDECTEPALRHLKSGGALYPDKTSCIAFLAISNSQ